MKDYFKNQLNTRNIKYGDIRYEKNNETLINYEGKELKDIKETYREGGHLKIYNNGSKVVGSFSEVKDSPKTMEKLINYSKLAGEFQKHEVNIKKAPVIKDKVLTEPNTDPRDYSLADKKELLNEYNDLAFKQKHVINTKFRYRQFYSNRLFINSEGSVIEYDLLCSNIVGAIIAKKDDVVQVKRIAFGGYPEFSNLIGREDDILREIDILQKMLDAEPIKAGTYPIIVNSQLASVFIHEAFGHLSEADIIKNNPTFRKKLQIGKKMGKEIITVIDDPTIKNVPGSYIYDDEGQKGRKTELIKDGVLTGRLHSRETAYSFSEPLSGNMRAVDTNFPPIIRMSNIFIDKGESSKEEIFNSIEDGYYLLNGKGGQTTGDQFTFGAEYGYKIKNGKRKEMVRDINISGELFETLKRISMVADDLTFSEVGGCGKGDPMQLNMFSGKGAPHIKIDKANLGGQ